MKPNLHRIFRFGIRQKVLLVLVSVLLCALTISAWLALEQEKKDVLQETNQRGQDITRFVAKSLAFSVVGYDYHTIQLLLDEITFSDIVGFAMVKSAKGNIMAQSGTWNSSKQSNLVVFSEAIILNEETVGSLTTGISTTASFNRLESQKYRLLQREALIILLIAIGEFVALSFIIVRPVSLISDALENNMDNKNLQVTKLPVLSNDEFGALARRFNSLGEQLNKANHQLHSKIDVADNQLRESNKKLVSQSHELQKISEEFRRLSITDSLTDLYNRRYFETLIEAEVPMSIRNGDQNSLMIIDVDHFKKINDTYGHYAGDTVLQEIAHRLKTRTRKTDTICRLGGEEFIVFCKDVNEEIAIEIAEKLRSCIVDQKFRLSKQSIHVSISIGVSTMSGASTITNAEEFYRCADIALYASKENGRNQVSHYNQCPTSRRSQA